jgi:serine protease Do
MRKRALFLYWLLGLALLASRLGAETPLIPPTAPTGAQQGARASGPRPDFAEAVVQVAELLRPSVVHIEITGTVKQQLPQSSPFGRIFPPSGAAVPFSALGSGILVDDAGHIITNNHVVENADSISVQFFDGSILPARLVGTDPYTDLAVLEVKGLKDVPAARIGDSETLRVGDWVVAIGSPRGLDWTVTAGIVSAKHRAGLGGQGPSGFEDFIQTDAAINPGNSGGPLINLSGEVIGINSMILSQSQGSEGLGFAIPAALFGPIAESLIRQGKVVRGDLGLAFQDLSPAVVKGLKLPPGTTGAVITEVMPDGPAANAGFKVGDAVLRFNGQAVGSGFELRKAISDSKPGSQVRVDILRDGQARTLVAKSEDQLALLKKEAAQPDYILLGLKVRALGAGDARNFGLRQVFGVVVSEVVAGSPAEIAGLAVGDAIFAVGRDQVSDPAQFAELVGGALGSGSVLLLVRDAATGRMGYLEVPLK